MKTRPVHLLLVLAMVAGLAPACHPPSDAGGDGGRGGESTPGGSGGSGGTVPGSGGAGGTGGTEVSLDWLLDDDLWPIAAEPSSMDPQCVFRTASPAALARFPALEWKPCGPGCEQTDLLQGIGEVAGIASSAISEDGRFRIGVRHVVRPEQVHRVDVRRVIDAGSGRTIAAIRVGNSAGDFLRCGFLASSLDPLLVEPIASSDLYTTSLVSGRADPETGAYSFRLPITDGQHGRVNCGRVAVESPGLPVVFACHIGRPVYGMLDPGSSALSVVSARIGWNTIAGLGATALYEEVREGNASRLLLWSAATGETPASTEVHGDICAVGLGDRLIAGTVQTDQTQSGFGRCGSYYAETRLAARPRTGDDMSLSLSPRLAGTSSSGVRVVTWGGFVAATMAIQEPGAEDGVVVALARASDWSIRYLEGHADQSIEGNLIGLDAAHLFIGETPGKPGFSREVAGFYRYDLARFGSLGHD